MEKLFRVLTVLLYCSSSGIFLLLAATCILPVPVHAQGTIEVLGGGGTVTSVQQLPPGTTPFHPIRTNSPRDTLESFLRLAREEGDLLLAYRKNPSRANAERERLFAPQLLQLLDLSSVPSATRQHVGENAFAYLVDIFGRVDLPPMERVPGEDAFDDEVTPVKWRIPGTPIRIARIEDGPREGEFLFDARTVAVAPAFYERIRHLPVRSSLGIENWHQTLPHLHGPMIPMGLVDALPGTLKQTWLDTPIWKILTAVVAVVIATLLLSLWHRLITRRIRENRIAMQIQRAMTPLAIIVVIAVLKPFVVLELYVAGRFALVVDLAATLVVYLAVVWIFWLLVQAFYEWMILSPRIPDESLDANLLRLSARVVGAVGGFLILVYAAQELGIPVVGLVAGLGVGGLAVALAIRPSLENLFGGLILFLDKPVRVGDFCSFGEHMGTVEHIGLRSTQIRALDRTLISIPNATFADMEIINWAQCDQMLIQRTIGLRYETEPDQLRYVLVELREMCHAHPKIDRDTVRVRFEGHGASSLDIQIRVYALTREWNEYFAIQEDVLLRVDEIVRESGTGFAFPSRTVYVRRDGGLDKARSEAVAQQVTAWRSSNRLPFPHLSPARIDELADTLDYPPRGSPGAHTTKSQVPEAAEPLSAEPQLEGADNAEPRTEPKRR